MNGLQPYPAYRDSCVGWGAGSGGDSDWAAMWEGPIPWVTGPLVVRERSGRDVKLRVYIDTSVIGGCVDEQFRGPSRRLIERAERGEVTLVVSEVTTRELERAPRAVREVLGTLGDLTEVVAATTEEVSILANRYIQSGALTEKSRRDAEHIAAATVAGVRMLASWNFRHMVNFRRIKRYNDVNREAGYAPLDIRSPKELENED